MKLLSNYILEKLKISKDTGGFIPNGGLETACEKVFGHDYNKYVDVKILTTELDEYDDLDDYSLELESKGWFIYTGIGDATNEDVWLLIKPKNDSYIKYAQEYFEKAEKYGGDNWLELL